MVVVMRPGASLEEIEGVCEVIHRHELESLLMPGSVMAIGIPSAIPTDLRDPLEQRIQILPGVSKVTQVSRSYKLASREFRPDSTIVEIGDVRFGGPEVVVMAGPCSIESYDQLKRSAQIVKASGATVLRGGAFKPRTSPYAFQGLADEGLRIMKRVGHEVGIKTISEVMSPDMVGLVADHVDILQIGARSMQNFPLLIEAGKSRHPVMLKRGPSATIDEFMLAAEYLLAHGNSKVLLCERGVHPLDRTYTRNTLDLSAVPVLKEISHLPVIVDPSHGVGVAKYVPTMACAAIASGADGLMVEVHPNPREALSDAAQALSPEAFESMMQKLAVFAEVSGRLCTPKRVGP
ncbi:MAG: 3-deoxy-7-phosphoheptulonate synthase [Armatimonadetes bacterium]|nr:3-deoxy-7-phosphoheptulonate synthase [Armatimonadota bacterium]